jgi:hypothetical protein
MHHFDYASETREAGYLNKLQYRSKTVGVNRKVEVIKEQNLYKYPIQGSALSALKLM